MRLFCPESICASDTWAIIQCSKHKSHCSFISEIIGLYSIHHVQLQRIRAYIVFSGGLLFNCVRSTLSLPIQYLCMCIDDSELNLYKSWFRLHPLNFIE